jgi:anti-anti-sigma factor
MQLVAGASGLEVQVRQEGEDLVLAIHGRITHEEVTPLREVINANVATLRPRIMLLNLEKVTHIHVSGIGMLVAARNTLNQKDGIMCLCNLCSQVRKAFEQCGLLNHFAIFPTEPDALGLKAFPPSGPQFWDSSE